MTEKLDLSSLQNDLAKIDMITMPPRKGVPSGILEALLLKREQLKLKMYQENGHARPHFHVDYGTQNHAASYAIDTGERIEGDLHCKYDKAIVSWVGNNRDALLKTWGALQSGRSQLEFVVALSGLESL